MRLNIDDVDLDSAPRRPTAESARRPLTVAK